MLSLRLASEQNENIIFTSKLHRIIQFIKVFNACIYNLSVLSVERVRNDWNWWKSRTFVSLSLILHRKSLIAFAIDTPYQMSVVVKSKPWLSLFHSAALWSALIFHFFVSLCCYYHLIKLFSCHLKSPSQSQSKTLSNKVVWPFCTRFFLTVTNFNVTCRRTTTK